ncbi:MAG: SDR family NAD(P)-dependent oxidoreductase, partial [Gemmatimonadales bacterium]
MRDGPSLSDLTGRVCVVTGATRGIGRATAVGLAKLGATPILICRKMADGAEVADEIAAAGAPAAEVVQADLAS